MPSRKAEAEWKGNLIQGSGRIAVGSGTFQRHALDAKQNCPVSKALAGTGIRLIAKLLP